MIKKPPSKKKSTPTSKVYKSNLEHPKMLKEIIENSRIGILRTTLDGRLLFCNSTLISLFGYTSFQEIKNIDISSDLYSRPRDRKKLMDKLKKYGFVEKEELLLVTKEKKEIPVVFTLQAKLNKKKEIKYIDGWLEDITLFKENEKKINNINRQLGILNKINDSLSQTLDLDYLLDISLGVILQYFKGEIEGVFYLAQDGWLVPESVFPVENGHMFFPIKIGSRYGYADFSSYVYETKKEFVVNSTHKTYFIKKFPVFKKEPPHSFAIFPVISGEEVLGVLNVHSNETDYFDNDCLELLRRIISQLSIYIHNALVYRATNQKIEIGKKKIEEINLSYDVAKRLAAHLEFDKIISECFAILKEQKFSSAKIYLTSEDGKKLDLLSYYNNGDVVPVGKIEYGKYFSGMAALKKKPVIVNDTYDPFALEIDPGLKMNKKHSFVSLPIIMGARCLGALTISSEEPNTFRQSVISFCDTISNQLAIVLNNAIQHSQMLKKNNELIQLYNTVNRLSKHVDFGDIINETFEIFKEMGFSCCKIYKVSDKGDFIELISSYDLNDGVLLPKMKIGENFSGKAAKDLAPVIINDTHSEDHLRSHPMYKDTQRHSFAAFPLEYEDGCIGVLNLVHMETEKFKPEIVNLCINIAKQLALLFNNSKIHDKTNKRYKEITLLYDVAKRLSVYISSNEIISECFKLLRELNFTDGRIYLDDNGNLDIFAYYSCSKVIPSIPKEIYEGKYFSKISFDRRDSVIINSTHSQDMVSVWPEIMNYKEFSFGAFPICYGDKKMGVINLAYDQPNSFDDFTINLIMNITYHLGIMINNSQLYEEVVKRNRHLKLLNELSQGLNKKMNLYEGSQIVTKKLEEIYEFDGFYLDIYDNKTGKLSNIVNVDVIDGEKHYFRGEQNREVTSPLIKEIIETNKPTLLLRENEQEKIFGLVPFGNLKKRAHSLMFSPLSNENEILGIIAVHSYKKNAYNNEDLSLLTSIGNYISVILRNIILYKHLSDSENRYRTLIENAPEAIFSFDKNGLFTAANAKTYEFLNSDKNSLLGKPVRSFLPDDVNQYFNDNLDDILSRNQPFSVEIKMNQNRYYENTIMPILEDDNNLGYFVGIARDITSQKEAEESNSRIQHQLSENKKHEFVVSMTRNIAHVFNNVLVNVLSRSSFAKTLVEKESVVYPHLEKIEMSSKRVGELVKQLLTFAQSGNYIIESLDLNKIIQFFYCSKKPQIKIDVDFQLNLSENNPVVISNRDQIIVMLDKLFTNSIEAIGEKGIITITSGIVKINEHKLLGSQKIESGVYGKLAVIDNGCGIREDIKKRFFEPFNTTKEYGRGLGLPSVFGIVMNMNGFINIITEVDRGTEVEIYLPLKLDK